MKNKTTKLLILGILMIQILSMKSQNASAAVTTSFTANEATQGVKVDGFLSPSEWSDAKLYSFHYNVEPFLEPLVYTPYNTIEFYVKNDVNMLYFAVYANNVTYGDYGYMDLILMWDVDKSNGISIGDFRSNCYRDLPGISDSVWNYVHNSQSGTDEWSCCSQLSGYTHGVGSQWNEGRGNITYEFAIALSVFDIMAGETIQLNIDYEENWDTTTIQDLTTGYLSILTIATTHNNYYYLESAPVLTLTSENPTDDKISLEWTSVEGADYYLVYTDITDWTDYNDYGTWVEYGRLVENTTALTSEDSISEWEYDYDGAEQFYVVIAVNIYDSACSNVITITYNEDLAENNDNEGIPGFPFAFLIGSSICIIAFIAKRNTPIRS